MKPGTLLLACCSSLSVLPVAIGVLVPRRNTSDDRNLRLAQAVPLPGTTADTRPYGNPACQCVGIDNMKGKITANVDNVQVTYPTDVGSSCESWDKDSHPSCSGESPPDWCGKQWCYVDACECDIEVMPKKSNTGLVFKGRPAFWSYATCGSQDSYSVTMNKGGCQNMKTAKECKGATGCAWFAKANQCVVGEFFDMCSKDVDESIYGQVTCQCVGISNKAGVTKMTDGKGGEVEYPADAGNFCAPWERDSHPECKGANAPAWCRQSWCWVDPCKCKAKVEGCGESGDSVCFVPPKVTAMDGLKYQGKDAYFSYETCGSSDGWTQSHREKYCVSQQTPELCEKMGDKCVWTGLDCVGKDLAKTCSAAWRPVSMAALFVAIAVFC